MKPLILTLALVNCSILSQAQDLKLLEITSNYYPGAKVKDSPGAAEATYKEFGIGLKLPVVVKKQKTILLNAFNYSYVNPEFTNSLGSGREGKLHFVSYSLSLIQILNEKLKLIVSAMPAISSDLEVSISSDDFLFLGSAFLSKRVSDNFSWGLGLAYTTRFGEPLVLPMVEIKHENERFKFAARIPSKIEALWSSKSGKVSYGVKAAVNGSQFNLTSDSSNPVGNIRFSRINLGPVVNYQIKGPVYFTAFTGISMNRKYEIKSDLLGDLDFNSENGLFVSAGLFLAPQKKNR